MEEDFEENEMETYDLFYKNFDDLIDEDIVKEIYDEAILSIADENDWSGEEYDEFENEQEWYQNNRLDLGYQAEENTIEQIISKVFEDTDVNISRIDGDDYLEFEDHIKTNFPFLDPENDEN